MRKSLLFAIVSMLLFASVYAENRFTVTTEGGKPVRTRVPGTWSGDTLFTPVGSSGDSIQYISAPCADTTSPGLFYALTDSGYCFRSDISDTTKAIGVAVDSVQKGGVVTLQVSGTVSFARWVGKIEIGSLMVNDSAIAGEITVEDPTRSPYKKMQSYGIGINDSTILLTLGDVWVYTPDTLTSQEIADSVALRLLTSRWITDSTALKALIDGKAPQTQLDTVDRLNGALAVDSTWDGSSSVMTVDVNGGGFARPLFVASDGHLEDADASDSTKAPCMYMAIQSGTGAKLVLRSGYICRTSWDWIPGKAIFLSETIGTLTQTRPTTSGAVVQVLGIAITADMIDFRPDPTLVEVK